MFFPSISQMMQFLQRIGETGCEWLLQVTIEVKVIDQEDPAGTVGVDMTIQLQTVVFSNDALLFLSGLRTLVREAKRTGTTLRQSYT